MGCPEKKIKTVPKFLFNLGTKSMLKQQKKNKIEGGLYMPRLCDIKYGELYIDRISAAYRWELQRTILTRLSAIP